jgi:large subunit ribosomal protein L27
MAHTKSGGKTRQHSQRAGKRLGLKIFGGEKVKVGQIIIRQRGTKFHPGQGVEMGRDHTLFAIKEGIVQFKKRQGDNLVVVV